MKTLQQKAMAFAEKNAYDDAAKCFEQILHHDPNRVDALLNAGLMHYYAGRYQFAEQFVLAGIAKDSQSPDAYYYLGLIYTATNHPKGAINCYHRAVILAPQYEMAWYNLGSLFFDQKEYDAAISCYKKVLEINPNCFDAGLNIGESYARIEQFEKAIQCFKKLVLTHPNSPDVHYNMGVAYNGLRQYRDAIAAYDRALAIDAGHVKSHYNKSFILLLHGDYINGFAEYEWRLKQPKTYQSVSIKPRWQGNPIPNQTLFMYAEQGFGDCIQYIRFLPMIRERVGRLILECQPELTRLFSGLKYIDLLIPRGSPLPAHDYQASLLSMGYLMKITLQNLPQYMPYLTPTTPLSDRVRQTIHKKSGQPKIGIVWGGTGSTEMKTDMGRSMRLQECLTLFEMKNIQWFSFQKGARAKELNALTDDQLIDLGKYCADFADTAAAASQMDLIITIDTAMAHLAGALGLPVWVLLSYDADWRWLLNIRDNPWYPGMRVFRQLQPGHWRNVLIAVQTALKKLIEKNWNIVCMR